MTSLKDQQELAVGTDFIAWYNDHRGSSYILDRKDETPDLWYRDGNLRLPVEIGAAYHNEKDAKMRWMSARGRPDAPDGWVIGPGDVDQDLVDAVSDIIAKKAKNPGYPAGTLLVVPVYPTATSMQEFDVKRAQIAVPRGHPFLEIYVAGRFGESSDGSGPGYQCWRVA